MRLWLYVLLFVFNLWGLKTVHRLYETRNQYSSHKNNTVCSDSTNPLHHLCTRAAPVQFDRFIWLVTDGMPVVYSRALLDNLSEHSISYQVDIKGLKYSHAIYTAHLNGQPPTNYKGLPITQDHLILSMNRANFSLRYYGPEWSWLAISGKEHYDELYEKVTLYEESKQDFLLHSYPFWFESPQAKQRLDELLEELSQSTDSVIAHSGVFDHLQHGSLGVNGFTYVDQSQVDSSAIHYAEDMLVFKRWVDHQKDRVLLIVSSDHGIDEMVAGSRRTHGGTEVDNKGYFTFYHPSLEPREMQMVDVVDVCSTFSSYLRGVSVPYDNNGVSRATFGSDDVARDAQLATLRLNVAQLNETAITRGLHVPVSAPGPKATAEELIQVAETFRSYLVLPLTRPVGLWYLYLISFVAINVYLVARFQRGFIEVIRRGDILTTMSGLGFMFVSVGFFSSQLLSRFYPYGEVFKNGMFFWIWTPVLGLLMLYSLASLPTALHSRPAYRLAIYLAFLCEIVNWGVGAFFNVYGKIITGHLSDFQSLYAVFAYICALGMVVGERLTPSKERISGTFLVSAVVAYLCSAIYENSALDNAAYVGGVHFAAGYVFIWSIVVMVTCSIVGQIKHVIIALVGLCWLLCSGQLYMRIVLLMAVFQFRFLLHPLVTSVFMLLTDLHQVLFNLDERRYLMDKVRALHQSGVLAATTVTYYLLQPFFLFVALQSDQFNLDFNPNVGAIGLLAWDKWPVTSSLMMMTQKYQLFILFSFCCWESFAKLEDTTSEKQEYILQSRRVSIIPDSLLFLKPLELFSIMLFMLIFSAHLGYYHAVVYFSRFLPINEFFAYTTTVSTMVLIVSTLGMLRLIRSCLTPRVRFKDPELKV